MSAELVSLQRGRRSESTEIGAESAAIERFATGFKGAVDQSRRRSAEIDAFADRDREASKGPSIRVDGDISAAASSSMSIRASKGPSIRVDGDASSPACSSCCGSCFKGAVDQSRRRYRASGTDEEQ